MLGMKGKAMAGMEKRTFRGEKLEIRKEGGKRFVEGVLRYKVLSEDLGGFREQIAPSVFTRTLNAGSDVKMLWNHNDDEILGSTKAGTLVLESRADGLHFSCLIPETASNRFETIQRGDVDGVSFGFIPEAETWDHNTTPPTRTLTAARLIEISPTPFPAYPAFSTQATQRSRDAGESLRLRLEIENTLAEFGRERV